jgi:murein DD-endopeptidase MepM/ murein hydrolase activator NlpD
MAELAAAVVAAERALQGAEAQRVRAEQRLADAARAREAAESVRAAAARSAAMARVAEQQARRALAEMVAELDQQRHLLGALAREAYQTGGRFSSLSVVLESTSPQEFAATLRGVQSVLGSEDVVLADMAADLAELAEADARLQAARQDRERAEDVASKAFQLAQQAEQTAQLVARETAALVDARQRALELAQEARADDLEQYRGLLVASQAVGTSLVGWTDDLDDIAAELGSGDLVRPGTGVLTSPFGPRLHPVLGYVKLHTGVDLSVGDGRVYSADDGLVVLAGYNEAYGNMTVISHGTVAGSALATVYAHQSQLLVGPGDRVRRGQAIGIIGSTGYSTGPHLHFEIRVDGAPVDPMPWLVDAPYPGDVRQSNAPTVTS